MCIVCVSFFFILFKVDKIIFKLKILKFNNDENMNEKFCMFVYYLLEFFLIIMLFE